MKPRKVHNMYFTYILGWSTLDKMYYGVRYKDNVSLASVGTDYFSSSKTVFEYIKKFGNPDIIQIRKVFSRKVDAKRWEDRVLCRLLSKTSTNRQRWLNKSNTNSLAGVVMDEDIKRIISLAKLGKKLGTYYNDGSQNKVFKEGVLIPEGWVIGRLQSEKDKERIRLLNVNNTPEKRLIAAEKISKSTKGKPKPEGHGAKVSASSRGKPKPWATGENNVSKRADVRAKISEKRKGIKLTGVWWTDGTTNLYVKSPEIVPEGFYRGRCKNEKKYKI